MARKGMYLTVRGIRQRGQTLRRCTDILELAVEAMENGTEYSFTKAWNMSPRQVVRNQIKIFRSLVDDLDPREEEASR